MEPIESPDHATITKRIQRIRSYLKSTLATNKEVPLVLYREKNEPPLSAEQWMVTSERDARWKHPDDLAKRENWHVFGQFGDTTRNI